MSSAAGDDAEKRASAHFRRGVELFQEGAYRAAIVEFKRAYDVAPNYRLRYNIAQTQIQLLDYLGAVQSYEAYLTEGGAEVPEKRREEVETALAALRERIGRIAIKVNVAGAQVFVDEVLVGVSPLAVTVPVNVGRHRIHAVGEDGAEDSEMLEVAGGDVLELALELKQAAPSSAVQVVAAPVPQRGLSTQHKYAIASVSLGGASAVGAVLTGLAAKGAQDDLDAALDERPNDAGKVEDLRGSTKMLARTTDALAGVALLAIAASITLWVVDSDEDAADTSKPQGEVAFGLGKVSIRGRF